MLHPVFKLGAAALFGLGAAGLAVTASASGSDITCGFATTTDRGMTAIEGTLLSPVALTGEYRFALKSTGNGGSTNISQGGQFSAAPGTQITLGRVTLNAGASVAVDFTVTANGKTLDCSSALPSHT